MQIMTASHARANFFGLLRTVAQKEQAVIVQSKTGPVLVSPLENVSGWKETAFLDSVPGLKQKFLDAKADKDDAGVPLSQIDWENL